MKRPSRIKVNILLIFIAAIVVAVVVGGLWAYGRYRAEEEAKQKAREATVTPVVTATETPAPTPEVNIREELLSAAVGALDKNRITEFGNCLRYRDEQGNLAAYDEKALADCVLYLRAHEELYEPFRGLLAAETTEIAEEGGNRYFVLAGKNLWEITGTPRTEEEIAPELATPTPTEAPVPNGQKIAIDPGHQAQGDSEQEPVGPGSDQTKAKVASGTHGDTSGLNEYELNLAVSLKLRDELAARGYEVYMIRETNEVNISNRERAEMAAASGADILIRIHANGSADTSVQGALTMAPSTGNPYVGSLALECQKLSQDIIDAFCASTGAASQGVYITDEMSGINWSTIPVTIVEMGYMTNPDEDLRMASGEYQDLMVQGIANGVDSYFAGQSNG